MSFYLPTKVFVSADCVAVHSDILASLGKHALIVTGKSSSKANGSLNDVRNALDKVNVKYTIFDEVEENPSVETVMKARDVGVKAGVDFVVGVGGGSPLDASKAIAVMIKNQSSSWELMFDGKVSPDHLPVAAVPTTCGTGSEVTAVAVLTRHDLRTKLPMIHKVFPVVALCDSKYLTGAPKGVIRRTAVDALGHMVESYINSRATPFSRMCADAGFALWKKCKEYLLDESSSLNPEIATNLLEASTFAGMAIAQTGTSIPHGLSYTLTYEGGIPHGTAVGLFQSGYLRHADEEERKHVLGAIGFDNPKEVGEFITKICPVTVSRELLTKAVDSLLKNPSKLANCPYKADETVLMDIINDVH